MIDSIRIQNFRSFRDTGFIKLNKLNILLGTNSSGKSSFLRSFPLFSQSIKKNLRGPISWFDYSSVDFGDYDTAKWRYADETDDIIFSYIIKKPFLSPINYWYYESYASISTDTINELKLALHYKNDLRGTFVNKIVLVLKDVTYCFSIDERNSYVRFNIEGKDVNIGKWRWSQSTANGMMPSWRPVIEKETSANMDVAEYLYRMAVDALRKHCNKRLKNYSRLNYVISNWTNDHSLFLDILRLQKQLMSLSSVAFTWNKDDSEFLLLSDKISPFYIYQLLRSLNLELANFYETCRYIAPIRAEANRFYRSQGLNVNEIDSYGKNLAEFVSSLSDKSKESYEEFCQRILGQKVMTNSFQGQSSIMLSSDNITENLVDVGFGYSQILPIITQLWLSTNSTQYIKPRGFAYVRKGRANCVLIEQPELHLHPAMQAKIADAFIEFVKLSTEKKTQFYNLIVESHSQAIINRLGRRIREGVISPDDINVILFEKSSDFKETAIRQIGFNKKGQLNDWPYGFFDPLD